MKKIALSAALLTLSALPLVASAQSNQINITGTITKAGCSVTGATTSVPVSTSTAATDANGVNNVTIALGSVSAANLKALDVTKSNPVASANGSEASLSVSCSDGGSTTVKGYTLALLPEKGTGLADGSAAGALKIASGNGAASGVAVAVFYNDQFVDLSNTSAKQLSVAPLTAQPAKFKAVYVLAGSASSVTPGTANATLPFEIRYN